MYQNFPFHNSEDNFQKLFLTSNFSAFDDINSFSPNKEDTDSFEPFLENGIDRVNFDKILPLIFEESPKEKTREESNKDLINFDLCNFLVQKKQSLFDKNYKEYIQQKIKENIYIKKPFKEKKLIGRKTKRNEGFGEHNKFSDDNLIRKCKHIVLDSAFVFINQKIIQNYLNNEDKDYLKTKQLFKNGQNQVEKSKAEYNKLFLNKTLQTIFSENISTKYSRYSPTHNKDLIEDLLNDKDETKRKIFEKIFKLTFLDCLKHFRGNIFLEELSGMKTFYNYCNETDFGNNSKEYEEILKLFINNYEKIVIDKKSRNKRNKKDIFSYE